jgi:hypothetical protein
MYEKRKKKLERKEFVKKKKERTKHPPGHY